MALIKSLIGDSSETLEVYEIINHASQRIKAGRIELGQGEYNLDIMSIGTRKSGERVQASIAQEGCSGDYVVAD